MQAPEWNTTERQAGPVTEVTIGGDRNACHALPVSKFTMQEKLPLRAADAGPDGPGSSSPGVAPALPGYFPYPSGTGVRVTGIRGGGAQVSGAQVVVADQLELAVVGLAGTRAAIAGRLTDALVRPRALPALWLAGRQVVDVFVRGLRARVLPCRALARNFPPLPATGRADVGYLPGPRVHPAR
jgi:hypothetical protein